ncbi:MAG TPA: hypothetical protein DD670_20750 [Planctomycetaceae bacterium]|nr:hypothetical protein [Planctomycetaceae bacterium]
MTYEAKNTVPATDFRLLYDVGEGTVGAEVLSYRPSQDDDGYFLLLASPDIKAADQKPIPKTVVFVVDRSGSMSGEKIKQAREALKFVLNNLREGDLFNIVAYDSEISSFRPELQRYNDETRAAATAFVEGIYAGGSTNIDGALGVALDQLKDRERPSYVVFLTDGLPTAGETNEMRIAANAKQNNRHDARIFSFGVGYDVDTHFLDKLVRDNHGQSEYVRPDQNIEEHVSRLYRRIESPVLTDVQIEFVLDEAGSKHGSAVNRVYPKGRFDLFAGEQLVIAGRYRTPGAAKVVLRGKVGDKEERFDFAAELVAKSADDSQGFVEKLWAVRRVGELIDEIDLKGRNEELVKELVDLSIRHGILTPYTSFMADDTMNMHDLARARGEAGRRLDELRVTDGRAGVSQRAYKGSMQQAARAPAAASSSMSGESLGAGMGASGYGGMGGALAPADREVQKAEQTIRQIGNRTFYLREGQWIDSTLDEARQKNPKRIKQFSDEYFELAGRHGRAVSQYLVFDEPVLLEVEGRAYLIEP